MIDKETNNLRREIISYASKQGINYEKALQKLRFANAYRKVELFISNGDFIDTACTKAKISTKTYYKIKKLFQ